MKKWNALCLMLLLSGVLTACGKAPGTKQETKNISDTGKTGTEMDSSAEESSMEIAEASTADKTEWAVTVSTTAELISSIAPDAHITLKPGIYNFSALTEKEIAKAGAYVNTDLLRQGEFFIYNAPGLILEAEESGSVQLVTESGYADVLTLSYCDGAVLKGLVMGHEIEKGECDANVLKLLTSQSVTVADCSLFGCGTYGIYAEDAAVLTVTGTEIYECTDGIVYLFDTTETTFENCRFHDNDGMFFLLGDTQAEVMKSEISLNKGELLQGYNNEAFDRDAIRINFKDCVFRGNHEMGNTKDWPCASFEACDLSFEAASVPAGTTYDDLIERYRKLAADPNAFPDAYGAGEQNFLMIASEMDLIEEENVSDMFGYAIQDLNGDGVPELAIGFTPEYGAYLSALFTLVDGTPEMVFGKTGDGYSCLQDGSFFYDGYRSASENGRGIFCFTEDGTALSCKEFYFVRILDGEESDAVVYYNTTGSWEIEDSRKANMTLDEFWAWEPEYMYLSMTPFSAID